MLRFLVVVLLFAALVYALMWTLERRRTLGGGGRPAIRPMRRPRGPQPRQVAPDDDEDFLRWLERKRRKDQPGGEPPG